MSVTPETAVGADTLLWCTLQTVGGALLLGKRGTIDDILIDDFIEGTCCLNPKHYKPAVHQEGFWVKYWDLL